MYPLITLIAYIIDMIFGEFRWIKHPIVMMGEYIKAFEKRFYKDNKWRGFWLTISLIFISFVITLPLQLYLPAPIIGFLGSIFIAHNMLYHEIKDTIFATNKAKKTSFLVSRDTKNLSNSDLNKALIETYAENLSDGVIAPLLYLLFFGLPGIVIYKAINTLDSMVGYKTIKYKNFGYFSAKLDDIVNLIPSRITALFIMIVGKCSNFRVLFTQAKLHQSPNAGYPITAMALVLGVKLGGDTSYFGKVVSKPYFGIGKKMITNQNVLKAIGLKRYIDASIISLLILLFFM